MRTVLADYGYIADSDTPDSWGRICALPIRDNYWTIRHACAIVQYLNSFSDHHRGRHGFDGVAKRMRAYRDLRPRKTLNLYIRKRRIYALAA